MTQPMPAAPTATIGQCPVCNKAFRVIQGARVRKHGIREKECRGSWESAARMATIPARYFKAGMKWPKT